MAELEAVIEQKLIEQLIYGDSQWIYRNDLKTEEDLWNNFKYILYQNGLWGVRTPTTGQSGLLGLDGLVSCGCRQLFDLLPPCTDFKLRDLYHE